jgi:single-strand DNA-binding protein
MAGETVITVVGNLTADLAVANFTIASTPRTFDRQANEWKDGDALFLRASVWREFAEHVAGSLTKGTRVIATGRLVQRSYQDREGQQRSSIELQIEEIGPSLRYATAAVQRASRGQSAPQGTDQYAGQVDHSSAAQAAAQPQGGGTTAQGTWSDPGQWNDETPF